MLPLTLELFPCEHPALKIWNRLTVRHMSSVTRACVAHNGATPPRTSITYYGDYAPSRADGAGGRRNTRLKSPRGSFRSLRFFWALIQAQRDLVELRLGVDRQAVPRKTNFARDPKPMHVPVGIRGHFPAIMYLNPASRISLNFMLCGTSSLKFPPVAAMMHD